MQVEANSISPLDTRKHWTVQIPEVVIGFFADCAKGSGLSL